ncbi:hypothetical protein X943_002682 [Babesia divergens]|uniref:TFIIE beta domain-containing protein n=1 Tax=Babesia divergens TaxID=32595 RepID=A0AAD9LI64_BABDI|nr:hypothetical protein X943_002682 [Babesia divergens]
MSFVNASSSFHLHLESQSQSGSHGEPPKSTIQFSSRASNITYKGETCPLVYVTHKILRILTQHNRALHTLEVEKALRSLGFMGVDICTNKELFESLQKVKRIEFDVSRKLLLYRNPYQSITTPELLLEYINKNAVVKGLRVNEELLNANAKMIEWLDEIMKQRKVRAVRSNSSHIKGKQKCRYSGTTNQCSVYSATKCRECLTNVNGILLFPLGKSNYEQDRYKLDHDIKGLWDSVVTPPLEELLTEYNISQVDQTYAASHGTRKRRGEGKQAKNAGIKMRRIYNTHLFTAQELCTDISNTLRK